MANLFFIPQYIISGENALQMSAEHLTSFGRKALIVTDDMMVKLGNVKKLTDILEDSNISYVVYSGINGEPTHSMIDEGVEIYKNQGCDFLIGIGGGSPIDSMKAIGAVSTNGGSICDYMGKKIEHTLPPTCAIPTTAGTGSEATKVSIITNTNTGVKMLLSDPKLMATLAIVDPIFTLTAPPAVTAATGVDALTHAIEAYTSKKAFSMSDIYALSAIQRIFGNIYEAYSNGSNIDARREMSIAALEAGIAFSNASVTIVHGMSRPIGALFHVPHGLSNAMLLNVCLDFLKQGAVERLCQLGQAIGVFRSGMTQEEGAEAFVVATKSLLRTLNIQTPEEFGIQKEEFFSQIPKMAEDALISGSPLNTRRTPSKDDIMELYKKLWEKSE
ncbi:iron-containing alcohol dehydrogenase [Sinanaerobacter chloroacetimidivorans]|jgi:alcohol dehydrogenase class IV|uniref:Iron-containing alcohol dehydrogenase n=1 Tax=Sinanaerobacter chloroacetimidivorans TaxID=2818044 RepID=A0A8J7W6U7_9FIRM|nr:iron-containing alcohol dehydrogenase [Sinanaerobacter chloroacetimidivorans]MBR0600403.1 iron-containing alcohol dehydrogenase [Sinanaerobacter chloroacetimidivorans]